MTTLVPTNLIDQTNGVGYTLSAGGTVTDLASVPRILWWVLPPHGRYAKAAIIHDYLYEQAIESKDYADRVFAEAMAVLGVKPVRRRLMYWAVHLFGRGNYSSQTPPQPANSEPQK